MSLFNQSTKAVSSVIQEIADCVGASADAEMLARAMRSLNAGIEYFNYRANWDFMLTENPIVTLIAPFAVTGVSAVSGQSSAAVPVGHGILADDLISCPGIVMGSRVSATAAAGFGVDTTFGASIGNGTVVLTAGFTRDSYALPADWKKAYTVRLLASNRPLRNVRRRVVDRTQMFVFNTSIPWGYDIYGVAGKGKIRVVDPPSQPDAMKLNYYRRITPANAVTDGTTLDFPMDSEPYLLAWSKWHFLVDKSEGRGEQLATWMTFSREGIKTMLAEQTNYPDEDLRFSPGQFQYDYSYNPNSTLTTNWEY